MLRPAKLLALALATIALALPGNAFAADEADVETKIVLRAHGAAVIVLCKELDAPRAAAYDAAFKKNWIDEDPEYSTFLAMPEFAARRDARVAQLRGEAKEPKYAEGLKLSCARMLE